MKKFLSLIVTLFIAFTVAGCFNHHHHKKNKSIKSKERPVFIQPQTPVVPEVKAPVVIAPIEKQPESEPIKEMPNQDLVEPGERVPEKKEKEGWFW